METTFLWIFHVRQVQDVPGEPSGIRKMGPNVPSFLFKLVVSDGGIENCGGKADNRSLSGFARL